MEISGTASCLENEDHKRMKELFLKKIVILSVYCIIF